MTSYTYDVLNTLKRNLATIGTNLTFSSNNNANLSLIAHEVLQKIPVKLNWSNLTTKELFNLGFTKINNTNRWYIPSYLYKVIPTGTNIFLQSTDIPLTVEIGYTCENTPAYIPFKVNSKNIHNLIYSYPEKNVSVKDSFMIKCAYNVSDTHFNITLLNVDKNVTDNNESLNSMSIEIGKYYNLSELINESAAKLVNKNILLDNFTNNPNMKYICNSKSKLSIKLAILNHDSNQYEIA